jgi:hypothetical protein
VIRQTDANRAARLIDAPRQGLISAAGGRIARWVIMGDDNASRADVQRRPGDLVRPKRAFLQRAACDDPVSYQLAFSVEVKGIEDFNRLEPDPVPEEFDQGPPRHLAGGFAQFETQAMRHRACHVEQLLDHPRMLRQEATQAAGVRGEDCIYGAELPMQQPG